MGLLLITRLTVQSSQISPRSPLFPPGHVVLVVSEFSYFTKLPARLEDCDESPEPMAQYKYSHYLSNFSEPKFDPAHPPGTATPHTGIYKCQGCGNEVVSTAGDPLPPGSHHQHSITQGGIAWRLIVAAD